MKRKINKKGFTLIELLAVIVILGVILAIAIPSMTGYISNSRKDTMVKTAQEFLDGAKTLLISENDLPEPGTAVVVPVDMIDLDRGGVSPYNNKAFKTTSGTSYVLVYNNAASGAETTSKNYEYFVALEDTAGNCLDTVEESVLSTSKAKSVRKLVKGGSCSITGITTSGEVSVLNVKKSISGSTTSLATGSNKISVRVYE